MRRALILVSAVLLAGCATAQPPARSRPVPPPHFVLDPCLPWPDIRGGGEVDIRSAARAVRRAKEAHADCQSKLGRAQQYIRMITE